LEFALESGVYQIENKANGNRYIGSAINFRKRFSTHKSQLNLGRHHSFRMQKAWNKYGQSAFHFKPLLVCAPNDLLFYEQKIMDTYHPEYNMSPTAGNSLGTKHTEETKAKISKANKGNKATRGQRRNFDAVLKTAETHRGMKRSTEAKMRMSMAMKGKKRKPFTKETLLKLSLVNQGKGSLTPEQVKEIRLARKSGEKRFAIASRFNLCPAMVTLIVQKQRYGWVE